MKKKIVIIVSILVIAVSVLGTFLVKMLQKPAFESEILHCDINISSSDRAAEALIVGYNYHLLTKFASDNGMRADIRLSAPQTDRSDSTQTRIPDITVMSLDGVSVPDDATVSKSLDNLTCWITSSAFPKRMRLIDKWISDYETSEEHERLFDLFINVYEPFDSAKKRKYRSELGPYDSLIRANADSIGWDWKLLSAVIFQESRFKIDANSRTGSFGLMQVSPITAEELGINNLLDPAENIEAGVQYLRRLERIFRQYAPDGTDLQKFTLVAYNIGENKLKNIIEASLREGQECSTWEHLEKLLPSSVTSKYIKKIYDYYWAFSRILRDGPATQDTMQSGQTVQDLPLK